MKIIPFFSLIFFTVIFLSCDENITNNDDDLPDSDLSFRQHIQPIFERKCVPCHNDNLHEGNLSLTTWSSTTADPGVVFPGNADNSRLVWAIEGNPAVEEMPPIGEPYPPLTDKEVQAVKKWINEGAKNN